MNCGSEVGLSRWLFLNVPIFVLYVCHDNGYFYDDDDYVNDMKKKKKKNPFSHHYGECYDDYDDDSSGDMLSKMLFDFYLECFFTWRNFV